MHKRSQLRSLIGQLALGVGAATVMLLTAAEMHPVFAGRPTVVQSVIQESWRDPELERAPWAAASPDSAMSTPQFEQDRLAFRDDLVRTGRIDPDRADSLATFAVREAYRRRVPPALVFGVLMTENGDLRSSARSNVGAVGLMQVYPKVWVRSLGRRFGTNLKDDETNLRYGIFILSHYLYGADSDSTDADDSVRRGLLRYNGCVRGSNTPSCERYPDVVRHRIEQLAVAQCGDDGYEGCVERPLRITLETPGVSW